MDFSYSRILMKTNFKNALDFIDLNLLLILNKTNYYKFKDNKKLILLGLKLNFIKNTLYKM